MPTVQIDEPGCRDCSLCVDICPTDVFEHNDAENIAKVARPDDCIGCTSCAYLCPSRCLTVSDAIEQRPFHRIEKNAALIAHFLQQTPAVAQLSQADYDEALQDTHVRLKALADALKEIMGRGQRAVGRSAGTLAAAHMPEMYEAGSTADLLAALRRRFVNAFDFDAKVEQEGNTIALTFPNCALRKVVSKQGEVAGTANLCDLFHEYWAGLMSAFSGRNYGVTTLSAVGQCSVKFQIRDENR